MTESAPARPAVVLLSGGLDSATCLALATAEGFAVHALSFRYGQRHAHEVEAARRLAGRYGVARHVVVDIDLRVFGGSALTADIAVPKDRPVEGDAAASEIPVTYVPARNTIFLSYALALAEVVGAADVFIGVNALDYSVAGDSLVWIRSDGRARLMPMAEACALPDGEYETASVDPESLAIVWRRITGRFAHRMSGKQSFRIRLERGQCLEVSEDHAVFTIDDKSGALRTIRGGDIRVGQPIVTPFDLGALVDAWQPELSTVTASTPSLPSPQEPGRRRSSVVESDGFLTNRLGRTRVPIAFPVDDDFLRIVGLWLAEGGKAPDSSTSALAFSIGGLPGAVELLRSFFGRYGVAVHPSPQNRFDHSVSSSVFCELFRRLDLLGTSSAGTRHFPAWYWSLSQRQRRVVVAALWDGDGSHVSHGEAVLAQKSHAIIDEAYHTLSLDGIFPLVRVGSHGQRVLALTRSGDFGRFSDLYPLEHAGKLASMRDAASVTGRDKTTGLWKCEAVWDAVAAASLPAGAKTAIYNRGGRYDASVRAQRSAFVGVPALTALSESRLAFLRVVSVEPVHHEMMYDFSVEGSENFLANGILAHNSGYPDCRPEYVAAFERMANLATRAGVEAAARGETALRLRTPLLHRTKAEIIRLGLSLGVDYGLTTSCYDPVALPDRAWGACGHCDACQLRLRGFAEAGATDPVPYAAS